MTLGSGALHGWDAWRACHVDTRKAATVPARFTASSACRADGRTALRPRPWASLSLLRMLAKLFTTFWRYHLRTLVEACFSRYKHVIEVL